jgi:L,D-peptidoglycan transpeptidase YkuD (ErfK/YbiS/YcfS/YnhG family)
LNDRFVRELIVTAADEPARGVLEFSAVRVACALGRTGILLDKTEGDGATPAGRWPLRRVLYRPDRLALPETALSVKPISPNDGWCDDPADMFYNRPVLLPYSASAERMWRPDNLYDLVIVLGHNDDPVIPGRGSAIFMHLTENVQSATAGCIALTLADMRTLLRHCSPATDLIVQA